MRHSRGKYVEAVSDFSEALRLDPSDTCTLKLREHSSTKAREVRRTSKIVACAGRCNSWLYFSSPFICYSKVSSPVGTVRRCAGMSGL